MRREEQLIEQRQNHMLELILAKHKNPNLNLAGIFEARGISPSYFYHELFHPQRLIDSAPGNKIGALESILNDAEQMEKLLRMDYKLLESQYADMQKGRTKSYIDGTFDNQENVEDLIYIAMVAHAPLMHTGNRKEAVQILSDLNPKMKQYFRKTGAWSIYNQWKKRLYSIEAIENKVSIMELFDNARRRIKKDKSLFDLKQEHHLPLWEFWYGIRESYWKDAQRASTAAFYILSKDNPKLKSRRETARKELKGIENTIEYFESLGFLPLIKFGYEGRYVGSKLAVYAAFDDGYRDSTGNARLFDGKNPLHEWDFRVANGYWSTRNRKRAVYQSLVEYDARFKLPDAEEATQAIRDAKERGSLKRLFSDFGLSGLRAMVGNNVKMFRIYDSVRRENGWESVFKKIKPSEISSSRSVYK